jgi:hypothetical protein
MPRLISRSVFAPYCQQLLVEQSKNLQCTFADLAEHPSSWQKGPNKLEMVRYDEPR